MKHYADLAFMKHWTRIGSLLVCLAGFGQDIAVGTWRTHYSYQNAQILQSTGDKLFCAVENGLFSFSTSDQSIRKLSKLDGLSGAGISAMHFDEENQVLIIGYSSGLIDLIYEDRIETLREVADSNLEGDKKIQDIASGNGRAFLGSGLGVIVINLFNSQISENYIQIGSNGNQVIVNEVSIRANEIFLLTEEGIQSGDLNLNLLDFNNWTMYPSTEGFNHLTLADNEIYALSESSLFRFSNDSWINTAYVLPDSSEKLQSVNGQLLIFAENTIYVLNESVFDLELTTSTNQINDVEYYDGQYFIADAVAGVIDETGNQLSPDGPLSDTYSRVEVLANEVFGFHAPSIFTFDGTQDIASYSLFSDGRWDLKSIEGFANVSDVAFFNGVRYFSSLGHGLFIESTEDIIIDIPESSASADSIITSLDARGTLWLVGMGEQPIHSLDQEENWRSYTSNLVFNNEFLDVDITETGIAWALASDGDITAINEEDDEIDILSGSDGIPSDVLDFTISIEDNAWVGTSAGPAFFPSASSIFFDAEALRPTFDNRILFEDQQINTVMTDGGNRIWFGTNRGLWVFDENTSELVTTFDEQNSPLPSNVILDLAYNSINGEVFVVTDKGMVSYRSASSNGSRIHQDVTVFPNPVRPAYNGLVGISGLARNTSLKITDLNGNLVKELQANGSSASWNLLDQNGSRVVTGIYFFFSSTSDGEETFVGKVAVVR